ncbi:hypothetical protein AKUA2003_05560 [Apilactobacillus kunkeei]|nr:hypothetical protein AKUA1001_05580 [Apilactobacillus kunkeei]CAI2587589.1 hypothetical protein AKUA2003_05560 [Apilactobacillus kunkeei]CAI2801918.1 hypothetical protein AKUA2002_05560 [Apilactobacillus kunkeei]
MIETIIALVILSLIAFTITLINPLKKSSNEQNVHAIDFQLFLNNISERNKHYALYKTVGKYEVSMINTDTKKQYRMLLFNGMIIISGINGGYYPMLDNVKDVWFGKVKKHLKIKVLFTNNEVYEDVSSISYE